MTIYQHFGSHLPIHPKVVIIVQESDLMGKDCDDNDKKDKHEWNIRMMKTWINQRRIENNDDDNDDDSSSDSGKNFQDPPRKAICQSNYLWL